MLCKVTITWILLRGDYERLLWYYQHRIKIALSAFVKAVNKGS